MNMYKRNLKNISLNLKISNPTLIFFKYILFSALILIFAGIAKSLKFIPTVSYLSPKGTEIISKNEKCMTGNLESCLKRKNTAKSAFAIGDSHLMNHAPSIRKSLSELGYQNYFCGNAKHIEIFLTNCFRKLLSRRCK